ncbi:MAG: ParB N-terminal domain-containing protein, partial [bacterium]
MAAPELTPRLQLVPVARIRFNEHPEHRRTFRLVERIKEEMTLRNPPIVAEIEGEAFLLLDGANRVGAFRELGFSHVPVQVVDYGDDRIELKGWHHLLVNGRSLALRSAYEQIPGVRLEQIAPEKLTEVLEQRAVYAVLVDETTACWALWPPKPPEAVAVGERIAVLEQVVGGYEGQSKLERVKLADFSQLPEVIRTVEHQLCLFPVFHKAELLNLAAEQVLIPTGLSRHLIPGRALGLNL